jgi:hypothetical protein
MERWVDLRAVLKGTDGFTTAEAIAVALELIESAGDELEAAPPFGPPALENVCLSAGGRVACSACSTTLAVSEIAILLDTMLPRGGSTKVPGAVRYTIARALLEVDAPPFDSIQEFADALRRHEQDDRRARLRDLYARASVPAETATPRSAETANVVPRAERRRHGAAAAELRRHLRAADEERYQLIAAAAARSADADRPIAFAFDPLILRADPIDAPAAAPRFRPVRWLVGGSMAALLAFGAGYALVDQLQPRVAPSTIEHIAVPADRVNRGPENAIVDAARRSEPNRRRAIGGSRRTLTDKPGPPRQPAPHATSSTPAKIE